MNKLRERRNNGAKATLKPVKDALNSWFNQRGLEFIGSREFSLSEELLIEELTDFYLDKIKEL